MGRSSLFLLAATGLAVGFIALGTLTTPEPEATPTPTSTTTSSTLDQIEPPVDLDGFSIDQIETGAQFDWKPVAIVDDAYPYSVMEHRGWVYVFTSASQRGNSEPRGLRAWRSDDGVAWQELGTVIGDEHQISMVTSTALGLVAVEPDGVDDYVHIWGSVDGVAWLELVDGIPSGAGDNSVFNPSAIAATDRLLAIAGENSPDAAKVAERYVMETTGEKVDLSGLGFGWSATGTETDLTIYGPLGLPALRVAGSELDLTDEERDQIAGYFQDQPASTTIWTKGDDSEWTAGEIDGADWVTTITPSNDGGLMAFGYGNLQGTWRSTDGIDWERLPVDGIRPYVAEMWGDGYVGLGDNGVPDVLISDDGRTWQGADLGESFPPGMSWYPTGFAAGDGGIGVMSETWVADTTPRGVPDPPSIERDGHTLSLDHRTGRLTLDSAQGAQSWSVWTEQSQDGIELDLEKRVVAFLDSNTGEPTVSFSFDELNEMESALYPSSSGGVYHRGFSFSADGANWTMQNMATEIGEDGRVLELEVTDDHVVALVSRDPDWTRPYGVESFEIWSAAIPDEASSGNGTSP